MASDLVVALGQATVGGTTLFGCNGYARRGQRQRLQLLAGGNHPPDDSVRATYLRLPQARQTFTVLGCQPEDSWGFARGVNEHHVAVGVAGWHSRLPAVGGGLTGTDLARLALERGHTALHALDILTELIARHGQCPDGATHASADNLFLVADRQEAFVLEAAGRYWAVLECNHVRAATDVALIRQDWQRLSPGLSALAIENGWWDGDGSKLDFAGCLDANAPSHSAARRRWGRATLALEQQSGAIDGSFLRRMLLDHHDGGAVALPHPFIAPPTDSFMTTLTSPDEPVLAWCAFGPPRAAVFFPVWLDGELPAGLCETAVDGSDIWQQTHDLLALTESSGRPRLTASLERLQAIFEQDAETFLPQARVWRRQGEYVHLRNQATELMKKHVALFAREYRHLHGIAEPAEPVHAPAAELEYYFS